MARGLLRTICVGLAFAASLAPTAAAGPRRAHRCSARAAVLEVRVVPALGGVRFGVDGHSLVTDARGTARTTLRTCTTHRLRVAAHVRSGREWRGRFSRWGDDVFTPARTVELRRDEVLEVGFEIDRLVQERFVDLAGRPVPTRRVSSLGQSNSLGSRETFAPGAPHWLAASRIIRRSTGLRPTQILYSVQRVVIDGTNVVRRAQQRFYPVRTPLFKIRLLLYTARVVARDRLFGFPSGRGIEVKFPDGHLVYYPFRRGSRLVLSSLPRGTYDVTVKASGLTSTVPVALTRNQVVELKVVSNLDLAVVFGGLFFGASGLLLVGRPRLRQLVDPRPLLRRLPPPGRAALSLALGLSVAVAGVKAARKHVVARAATLRKRLDRRGAGRRRTGSARFAVTVAAGISLSLAAVGTADAAGRVAQQPVPTFAYYYIWFDHGSWARAKIDYPLAGRYSSDDTTVMRQQVELAQNAGLEGFIVSWKSTRVLNRRLEALTRIAGDRHFKLAVIYQGLDFAREPLPVSRIVRDLESFAKRYGSSPVFGAFGKPLVIWSGTWKFTPAQIAVVSRQVRGRLLLLASEKSRREYESIATLVDGDAYYWSSVNPKTFPGYDAKLAVMGAAVHERRGLWVAPAAPGFDARLVGGSTIVPRNGGDTLRREYASALSSAPDAVGVISWNEFSENSHIEPSVEYGTSSLSALADILGGRVSERTDFDSSDPTGSHIGYVVPLLVGLGFIAITSLLVRVWRREIHHASQRS